MGYIVGEIYINTKPIMADVAHEWCPAGLMFKKTNDSDSMHWESMQVFTSIYSQNYTIGERIIFALDNTKDFVLKSVLDNNKENEEKCNNFSRLNLICQ